tara:strand:- start:415 stop:780 length:366 start_codon:yes stop_codon:yes gene_type:complete
MTKLLSYEGATFKTLNSDETSYEGGSWKVGTLNDVTYAELVDIFGKPTYPRESGDFKVQVEWAIEVNDGDRVYTLRIYDWKTYDRSYTMSRLNTWSIGGNNEGNPYLLKSFVHTYQSVLTN